MDILLDHGVDVNYVDELGQSPLLFAIENGQDEEVIRALLEKGATVDTVEVFSRRSILCYAFQNCSNDVIKMMLDAGYSPNTCEKHISALFCATDKSNSGLREDILNRLLQEEVDLNSRLHCGQSLFCFAMCNGVADIDTDSITLYPPKGTRVQDLELLLNKGASMQACLKHDSPLLCATSTTLLLQESVIKLLLDRGACLEDNLGKTLQNAKRWEILTNAIGWWEYETGAIRLLLDVPGMMDCIKKSKESILLVALRNGDFQDETVELLISRMSPRVIRGSKNKHLLHSVVNHRWSSENIVKILLKYDMPVNETNKYGDTPLVLAVKHSIRYGDPDFGIVEKLLIAGARIGDCDRSSLLEYVLKEYMSFMNYEGGRHSAKILEWFKILVKFFFLQNPQFDLEDCKRVSNEDTWQKATFDKEEFEKYANVCLKELKEMESRQIGEGLTLCEYVRGYCLPDKQCQDSTNVDKKNFKLKKLLQKSFLPNEPASNRSTNGKIGNLDQFFKSIADNKVKVYFDVLLARLDKSVLKRALPNLNVSTSNKSPDAERVHLNEYVLGKIASFLFKKDLLSFILAFYDPGKSAIINKLGVKRKSESTTKLQKLPKLLTFHFPNIGVPNQ